VLQGLPSGKPIQSQTVKLLPPDKPELPASGIKTAQDSGFDKPPAQCTTGNAGECKIDVPPEDRELYRLSNSGGQQKKNYHMDIELQSISGALVETTGGKAKPDVSTGIPSGAEVASSEFKIGNRTFARLTSNADNGVNFSLQERYGRSDSNYEEDYCRDKQPGLPLGIQPVSLTALNHELPEARLKFRDSGRAWRLSR
jgi:hypothetical protein